MEYLSKLMDMAFSEQISGRLHICQTSLTLASDWTATCKKPDLCPQQAMTDQPPGPKSPEGHLQAAKNGKCVLCPTVQPSFSYEPNRIRFLPESKVAEKQNREPASVCENVNEQVKACQLGRHAAWIRNTVYKLLI